jgi:glutaredoxin-dependent peroxiredoxin
LGQLTPRLTELGAQPVAVAVTATYSQQAFARSLAAPFPLLSDWSRQVCAAYGAQYDVWKGHDGLAKRSVFVIDRAGRIRYRWVTDDAAVQPDFDAVVDSLRDLGAEARPR